MTEAERLGAIEEIRNLKAKYWRGVDFGDGALVRSILADDSCSIMPAAAPIRCPAPITCR